MEEEDAKANLPKRNYPRALAAVGSVLAGLSLLGTLKVKTPSKRGVLRSKVCTTSGSGEKAEKGKGVSS